MFFRYCGRSLAKAATCHATIQPTLSRIEKEKTVAMTTETTRPKRKRSSALTTGFSTNVSSKATAIGTNTCCAQYKMATIITRVGKKIQPGILALEWGRSLCFFSTEAGGVASGGVSATELLVKSVDNISVCWLFDAFR